MGNALDRKKEMKKELVDWYKFEQETSPNRETLLNNKVYAKCPWNNGTDEHWGRGEHRRHSPDVRATSSGIAKPKREKIRERTEKNT